SSDLEQRECDVLRARRLDPAVHVRLHELPDGVPPRSDDHGSPRRAVVGQFGARNDVLVPGGEVLRLRGEYGLLHGVTVAAVATGYPGFRTVSNDSPDRGHPGRSAAGGPASTTAPPLHHSVGTGWYDRRRHPDHGYEIDRVDGSGVPPPRRNTPLVPDAEPLTGKAESGGGAHPRRPAHRPQDDQLERAGRQLRRGPRPRPAPAPEAEPRGSVNRVPRNPRRTVGPSARLLAQEVAEHGEAVVQLGERRRQRGRADADRVGFAVVGDDAAGPEPLDDVAEAGAPDGDVAAAALRVARGDHLDAEGGEPVVDQVEGEVGEGEGLGADRVDAGLLEQVEGGEQGHGGEDRRGAGHEL